MRYKNIADIPELDASILAYLISRGFTRSVKAFEGESKAKQGDAAQLERAWAAVASAPATL